MHWLSSSYILPHAEDFGNMNALKWNMTHQTRFVCLHPREYFSRIFLKGHNQEPKLHRYVKNKIDSIALHDLCLFPKSNFFPSSSTSKAQTPYLPQTKKVIKPKDSFVFSHLKNTSASSWWLIIFEHVQEIHYVMKSHKSTIKLNSRFFIDVL